MKKRFISLLIVTILLVSMIGIITAFAGVSISGPSEVLAGKTYTYTAKISYSGFDMFGTFSGGGSSVTFKDGSGGDTNESLSASVSISVSIPSGAKPGDKIKLKVSGQRSSVDEEYTVIEKGISGSKTITVVAKPVATPKPTRDPNATPRPTKAPEGWELVAIDVDAAKDGEPIGVTMEGDTKIPETLLADLIKKKSDLTVDFGTYQCTISAEDLTQIEGIKSLNLGLSFEKDESLSEVAGGKDTYQLHFSHEGQLPGKFIYTFKAEGNKPGDIVYLYYYYGVAGVIEGKQQSVVDENGMVTFEIFHCSSYFVSNEIIEDAIGSFAPVEVAPAPSPEAEVEKPEVVATPEPTVEPEPTKEPSEQTSTDAQTRGISMAGFVAALVAAVLVTMVLTMLFCKTGLFKKREE